MKSINSALFFLLTTFLFFSFMGNSLVLAEDITGPSGFKDVKLWVYPEYDDPRLLVMLEGQIVGALPPVRVTFLVPSAAEMYSAGSVDTQGQYTGGPPQRQPSLIPGWDEISYEVTTSTFRVEYYDPVISSQPDKSISYQFRYLYPITGLEVIVQEPRKASDFIISPTGTAFVDDLGFNSYLFTYPEIGKEQPLQFDITYTKADARPSLLIEDGGISSSLMTVVVIAVLVIAIAGVFLWMRLSTSRPKTRAERRQLTRNSGLRKPTDARYKAKFCSGCGEPLISSHKFCSSCGIKV